MSPVWNDATAVNSGMAVQFDITCKTVFCYLFKSVQFIK